MARSEGQRESRKHEDRLAKLAGGSRTAASGAFWSRKGDVRTDDLLIEHKWTGKKSFSISRSVLDKISAEAIMDGRMPVLAIHLDGKDYVVLDENDFFEMREKLGDS